MSPVGAGLAHTSGKNSNPWAIFSCMLSWQVVRCRRFSRFWLRHADSSVGFSNWASEMSSRRMKGLASALTVFWAGAYSRAIRVNDQTNGTNSSQAPISPDDEYPSAVADDDSDDSSDDLILLRGTLNSMSSVAA